MSNTRTDLAETTDWLENLPEIDRQSLRENLAFLRGFFKRFEEDYRIGPQEAVPRLPRTDD